MLHNQQRIEKPSRGDGLTLLVNSIFHTIQGEGPFAGTPAVFIRLAGCNLQCPMCDTEYTTRLGLHLDEVVEAVHRARPQWQGRLFGDADIMAPCDLVVITGGEPMRQSIGLLTKHLIDAGYRVQIETNGTLFDGSLNVLSDKLTIVCSPKTSTVNSLLVPWVRAWKYVATAGSLLHSDGLPVHALDHPNVGRLYRPPAGHPGEIYLQPVDQQDAQQNAANVAAVVDSCLKHGFRLCLQVHKIIGVP